MKKTFLLFALTISTSATIITSCNTPAEKVENAEENVAEANKNLDQANDEYLIEVESYRKETADRIAANEEHIAELKEKNRQQKKDAKVDYQNRIADLEERNSKMKMKMSAYKADGRANWESFRTEFGHDMDELGQSFKDISVDNVK